MNEFLMILNETLAKYGLITGFAVVGLIMLVSQFLSSRLMKNRFHSSSLAIIIGLTLSYYGGLVTGKTKGLADISWLSGVGILGGEVLRDFAIVSTAYGVKLQEFIATGFRGILSLFMGLVISFIVGALVAYSFGYRDSVSMTTIGAGAATYIVGPVTGSALGASSEVKALSIAAGRKHQNIDLNAGFMLIYGR